MSAVGVIEFKLSLKTIRRSEEVHSDPGEWTAIPTIAEKGADLILAAIYKLSDIVGLIQHTLSIVGEFGREHVTADARSIEVHTVAAESGDIESGAANLLRDVNGPAEGSRGLRQGPGITESLVA